MNYIENLIMGNSVSGTGQVSMEKYLTESIYITQYMSPKIKATNIATYHALFYLSYGQHGNGSLTVPWPQIGLLCGNEKGDGQLTKNESIRSRTQILVELGCIKISRNRSGANDFYVFLPSQIPFVKKAIEAETNGSKNQNIAKANVDCYNDIGRRIKILERDKRSCVYCLKSVDENSFYLDHIVPRADGGPNYKNNLATTCEQCNSSKSDNDIFSFF